ncbi:MULTISPECIES: hypothetical protein [unclassified Calothrix]|nr:MULTISPECIES: hypothetical protein [unclassified Calothrix]
MKLCKRRLKRVRGIWVAWIMTKRSRFIPPYPDQHLMRKLYPDR